MRARILNNLANLYSDTQRMKEAEAAYLEALALLRKLAQANPDAYLPYVATTLNNLAVLYRDTQRMKEAEAACRESEAILTPLWQAQPEPHGNQMARIWWTLSDFTPKSESLTLLRQALAAAYDPTLRSDLEQAIKNL